MKDEPVATLQHAGYTIKIFPDDTAESPREWSHVGTMTCWHSRYDLGDKHSYSNSEELLRELAGLPCESLDKTVKRVKRQYVMLPLYLYDHSGITISCEPFSCPWDSGQVGYTYVSLEDAIRHLVPGGHEDKIRRWSDRVPGTKGKTLRQLAEAALRGEVKLYDMYLTGQCYGYVTEDSEGNFIDSCWGYLGGEYDGELSGWGFMIDQAKSIADEAARNNAIAAGI